jgi:hypothetical protein
MAPKDSNHKLMVILYAEAKLQKSISLPGSFTISRAKQEGMDAIKEHLKILPGVPLVTLDPNCTDFYPGMLPIHLLPTYLQWIQTLGQFQGMITPSYAL